MQVRELDTAQSRIHATLARINIMVDRTAAINGVRAALDVEDHEAAARHVQAFLALEQRFGPIHDEHDSKQAQEQRHVRRTCCAHRAALSRHVRSLHAVSHDLLAEYGAESSGKGPHC